MWPELLFVLFCGLAFGSFVTCASYRLPLGVDIIKKPSYCPGCNAKLAFRDLWPVVSWVAAGGKCRHCAMPVSMRYPLIEIVTAGVFMVVYGRYGWSLSSLILCLMAVCLLIMIVADIEHYIIPDSVHVVLLPLGLAYHWLAATPPDKMAYGLLAGLGLGLSLHYGYRYLRKKDGLGFGDVKFFAVAGLWLGPYAFVPFMFLSGLLGVVFGLIWRVLGRGPVFPFGPALAAALFLCVAYPEIQAGFWTVGGLIHK